MYRAQPAAFRADLRRLSKPQNLQSIAAMMQILGWNLLRLRILPPGAELLPALRLAGRLAIAPGSDTALFTALLAATAKKGSVNAG